jgi:hypothetical protein
MKTFYKLATFALMTCVVAASALAATKVTVLSNLTEGQEAVSSSAVGWDGMSEIILIPGSALLGVTSTTTGLYLGFTAGSTVDIDNMVLYTTARNNTSITKAAKVTLGKVADPSINLTSTTTCPTQPVSTSNPCVVRLDTVAGALSPLNDYYFVVYFKLDSNNEAIAGAGGSVNHGALNGWSLYGDQTRITADGAIPQGNAGNPPYFLLYVLNE